MTAAVVCSVAQWSCRGNGEDEGEGETMTRKLARVRPETRVHGALAPASGAPVLDRTGHYTRLVTDISELLEQARRTVVRTANSILTVTYWEIGRRIVEFEQGGQTRAEYGEQLLARLAIDLTAGHGRGFSKRNLRQMRTLYVEWEIRQTPSAEFEARVRLPAALRNVKGKKRQTPSARFEARVVVPAAQGSPGSTKCQTLSGELKNRAVTTERPAGSSQRLLPASASVDGVPSLPGVFPLSWSQYVRLMSVTDLTARAFYEVEAIRGGWSVRRREAGPDA